MSWIWGLYVGMFLHGTVWACENIILVNWHLEFVPQKQRRSFLFLRLVLIASNVILTTALIQFVTRRTKRLFASYIFLNIIAAVVLFAIQPESPQYLVNKGDLDDFQKAREGLTDVARFNCVAVSEDGKRYE